MNGIFDENYFNQEENENLEVEEIIGEEKQKFR